jgi:hypothetical protein
VTSRRDPVEQREHGVHRHGIGFVVALVAGGLLMAFGARAALDDAGDAHPVALLVHVILFDLGHDLVIAPVAIGIGFLIGKVVPDVARGPVRTATAASALFVVFSYPLIRRWGRRPTNESALPLDYGRNVVILVAVVWIVAAAVIVRRTMAARRRAPASAATSADGVPHA